MKYTDSAVHATVRYAVIVVCSMMLANTAYSQESSRLAEFIPEGETPQLVCDRSKSPDGEAGQPGLNFTEGPSWIDGTLYFSNINFNAGSSGSAIAAMKTDGSYHYVTFGKMLTNGTMPLGNGNLAVCDMFGHRVVEMKTDGTVVRVIADKMNDGTRLDGPNDLVIDAKGGIYFSDPQYIPGMEHAQPGPAVYYIRPGGEVIRVVEVGEFAFPNGVLLSPDGMTLYVCNTNANTRNENDALNFIIAYTVNDDGTLSNKRRFAEMALNERSQRSGQKSSGADGMTIDEEGNLYVSSNTGMQIFDTSGKLVGTVSFPANPVNMCFGGPDLKTIYITANDRIYSLKTNKRGLIYPLK